MPQLQQHDAARQVGSVSEADRILDEAFGLVGSTLDQLLQPSSRQHGLAILARLCVLSDAIGVIRAVPSSAVDENQ